jgi:ElaB/YqjD/DUF883 family membrane-anchored ribosome-binding protein
MNQNPDRLAGLDTPAAEAGSTARKVAEVAHKLIDESAGHAEDIERQIRQKAGQAQDKVAASQEAAGAQLERSLSQIESFAKERPLAATGIAFAAGVLMTALLRR